MIFRLLPATSTESPIRLLSVDPAGRACSAHPDSVAYLGDFEHVPFAGTTQFLFLPTSNAQAVFPLKMSLKCTRNHVYREIVGRLGYRREELTNLPQTNRWWEKLVSIANTNIHPIQLPPIPLAGKSSNPEYATTVVHYPSNIRRVSYFCFTLFATLPLLTTTTTATTTGTDTINRVTSFKLLGVYICLLYTSPSPRD